MVLPEYDHIWCLKIISELMGWTILDAFKRPVDPIKDGVEDYFEVIKNPIDLGTIKSKLNNGGYDKFEDFVGDIKRIYLNCKEYNGTDNIFTDICADMISWFNNQVKRKCKSEEEEWKRDLDEITQKITAHLKLKVTDRLPTNVLKSRR